MNIVIEFACHSFIIKTPCIKVEVKVKVVTTGINKIEVKTSYYPSMLSSLKVMTYPMTTSTSIMLSSQVQSKFQL